MSNQPAFVRIFKDNLAVFAIIKIFPSLSYYSQSLRSGSFSHAT